MTAEEENRKHLDALLQSLLDLLPEEVVTKFHESLDQTPDPEYGYLRHVGTWACSRCGVAIHFQEAHTQWHRDLTSIVKAQGLVIGHIGFALHSLMEAFIATHPEVEDE